MTNQASVAEPYTLWYETLPSDDTARLTIARRGERFHAALFWNRKPHSERSFSTRDDAEAWGYELHAIVMQDALAGVLLGYDADVVTTLTNAVNL